MTVLQRTSSGLSAADTSFEPSRVVCDCNSSSSDPLRRLVGVAFDLEGTMVNLEALRHGSYLEAAESLGVTLTYREAVAKVKHFIGGPDERIGEDLFAIAESSLSKDDFVRHFVNRTREFFEKAFTDTDVNPRNGVVDFIYSLLDRKIPISIGSLTSDGQAQEIIRRSQLNKLFGSNVVFREDVKALKPAPDVYLRTAAIMNISPNRQIVFEDSPRGVAAAWGAGSSPIGMPVVIQPESIKDLRAAGLRGMFFDWRQPSLMDYVDHLIDELER